MNDRVWGYYWIRCKPHDKYWEVAKYTGPFWYRFHEADAMNPEDLVEVGPMVEFNAAP